MKLTVGVTTCNRPEYLAKMSASLAASRGIDRCNLRVYDDCSQFALEYLWDRFPGAAQIIRRPANLGADRNMYQMYRDFLQTDDEYLLAADSDLIFHPDWLDFLQDFLPYAQGVLSLYNSNNHRAVRRLSIDGHPFCEKQAIGSAGTVMRRDIVAEIVGNVTPDTVYDWAWSRFLSTRRIPLLVAENSYVQHIGLHGVHCDGGKVVDFGLNFLPIHEINQAILVEFFQTALLEGQKTIQAACMEKKKKFRNWLARH